MQFFSYIVAVKSDIQYAVLNVFTLAKGSDIINNPLADLHPSWLQPNKYYLIQVQVIFKQLVSKAQNGQVQLTLIKYCCQIEILYSEFI